MTTEPIRALLKQAKDEQSTSLNLADQQLFELPPEIGELTNLRELILGGFGTHNRLTFLPSEIGNLKKLTRLVIGGNQLSELPDGLWELENLKILDLGGNQLITLSPKIRQLRNLEELVIRGNRLTELPPEIGLLGNLKELYIGGFRSGNQLTFLPPEIGKLSNLTVLEAGGNQLRYLPKDIWMLSNLRILDLGGNQLSSLVPEIGELRSLVRLILSGNQLSVLPSEIGNLSELTELILGGFDAGNNLTALPPEIGKLMNLKELILGGNQIETLPREVWQLTNLIKLDLGGNRLTHISPEIGRLIKLRSLFLAGNLLTSLPPQLGQLVSLKELTLSGNQISQLPAEIGNLTELEQLDLGGLSGGNRIVSLPSEIGDLRNLTKLELSGNHLISLPSEISRLEKLEHLDLSRNHLTTLPNELGQLAKLTWLDLEGNRLGIPPEILSQKSEPSLQLQYYRNHRARTGERTLNEAKLLIVGQAGVGKTSLVRRLVEQRFDVQEPTTKGIDIRKWFLDIDGREVRLNIWDFGGQEIMHATHQFFLTQRSLYILVLDARQGEQDSKLEYWLKMIKSFGGDAPVIVVVNKVDEQTLELDRRGLQVKYPSIKGFAYTSCKNDIGISDLESQIKQEVGKLKHLTREWGPAEYDIKIQIEKMKRNYIPYSDYVDMCNNVGIMDNNDQRELIKLLHDLGLVLNFQDDPRLEDTNILNPRWITEGVYKILNSNELFQNKGVLRIDMLHDILDGNSYPRDKHLFLIDIMRKFELCFNFEGKEDKEFLIPDLLSKEEPYTGEWSRSPIFQYHYGVFLNSIISRFIVRMHSQIYKNTYWRKGVVLIFSDNRALVKADEEERIISVWISGTERNWRTILAIIRSQFDAIHGTIRKLEVKEKVPVPNHPGIIVDYDHLLNLEEMGIKSFVPEGMKEEVSVRELLDGIESEDKRRKKQEAQTPPMDGDRKPNSGSRNRSPWASGAFYLIALIALLSVMALISKNVSTYLIPVIVVAGVLSLVIIGVLQLKQDRELSEESFLQLMIETLKRLPLVRGDNPDNDVSE